MNEASIALLLMSLCAFGAALYLLYIERKWNMRNFNTKLIYHIPCVCMYCKRTYATKGGFRNNKHATHGVCAICFLVSMALLKLN